MKALVLATDGSEEIEVVTVVDVLRRAGVEVALTAVKDEHQVECSRHVKLIADKLLSEIATDCFDAIILPGGIKGAAVFSNDSTVQAALKEFEEKGKLVAAMCASTTALYAAQIGKGKRATSYPMFKKQLEDFYNYQEEEVVVDGKLVTSRGPATAMAWSLAIVTEMCGAEKTAEICEQMLYKK